VLQQEEPGDPQMLTHRWCMHQKCRIQLSLPNTTLTPSLPACGPGKGPLQGAVGAVAPPCCCELLLTEKTMIHPSSHTESVCSGTVLGPELYMIWLICLILWQYWVWTQSLVLI
jgi:hypothetical protein